MSLHRVWAIVGFALLGLGTLPVVAGQPGIQPTAGVAPGPPKLVTAPPMDQSQVGNSDVILTGSVTAVKESQTAPAGMVNGVMVTEITVKPDLVLWGTAPAGPVTVRLFGYGTAAQMPKVGDAHLFLLQRTHDGLTANLTRGVKRLDAVDEINRDIKATSLTITLSAPETPLYFGQPTPLTITLTNTSATPMKISFLSLSGFYYANRMESIVQSMISLNKDRQVQTSFLLDANSKQTTMVYARAMAPPSLALFGPDSYLITVASLHMDARFSTDDSNVQNFITRSNWVDALIGYPHSVTPIPTD
jgi:hypothetical protein